MIKLLKKYYHKNYHGIYQHAKKLFVFDLALLLFAVLLLGSTVFLWFWKPNLINQIDISISPGRITISKRLIPQATSTKESKIFAPQIISSAKLLDNSSYAETGQVLSVEIKWENKSNTKLQNITLHLTANFRGVVDWKKTATENNAKLETNGIFFDSISRTKLSDGNPGSNDTFAVKIYLLPNFDLPQMEKVNLEIYPVVKAQASPEGVILGPATSQEFNKEGSRIRLPLATEVDFSNVEARYYTTDGDQLGRGPLPPQVGKTTKYWVFVKILNTTNALNTAVFNTSLPEGVEFTGKQSTSIGSQLDYNAASRAITWKYDTLPANSQTGLYFEVAVTPKSGQIGQNILLTNSLQFSATDDFTNKKFEFSRSPLTNVLNLNDAGHSLGSKVRE